MHRNCLEKEEECTHIVEPHGLDKSNSKEVGTNRIRSYNLDGKSLSDVLVKSNILSAINYIEGELYPFNHLLTKWYKGILEIGLYSPYLSDI